MPDANAPPLLPWFEPLINVAFDGRFRIDQSLGEGGFGHVFGGFDEKMQRQIAVKVFPDPKVTVAQVIGEAQRLARLNHPGILTAYDRGEHHWERGVLPYLVTEFLPQSLDDLRVGSDGRVPVQDAIRIALEVLDALGEAHAENIVHRDLHSNNVLIDKSGRARVIDFGLAKEIGISPKSPPSLVAGVSGYLAPERFEVRDDPRSDFWSVGVLLIDMLTNNMPWAVTNANFMDYAAAHDPHNKLVDTLGDEALAPLDQFLDKMLAKEPEGRPATAAIASDLLKLAAHQVHSAAPGAMPFSTGVTTMREHEERLSENRTVAERSAASSRESHRNYWFVNQGISFESERSKGILGSGTVHWTHRTMRDLEVGDIVFHHAAGRIVAVGRVTGEAVEVRPGRLEATVEYTPVEEPIRVSDIPLETREREQTHVGGPFRRDGKAHQGYLFRVGADFADALQTQFAGQFPQLP